MVACIANLRHLQNAVKTRLSCGSTGKQVELAIAVTLDYASLVQLREFFERSSPKKHEVGIIHILITKCGEGVEICAH